MALTTNTSGAAVQPYEYDAFGNLLNAASGDTNPFRYSGEYFDSETGNYYLRARYYAPGIGRFTQSDNVRYVNRNLPNGVSIIDPRSLNLYVYCANDPVMYCDPSGHVWETVLDVAGIVWSIADFHKDPSLLNFAFLLWDVGSAVLPFVPGSYTVKGPRLAVRTIDTADDLVDAFNLLTDAERLATAGSVKLVAPYKQLKKMVKGLGLETHHLIEKRFATKLGISSTDDMLSIAIDKDTHKQITQLMRDKIGYALDWSNNLRTPIATPQDIWNAVVEVYTELGMTDYLPMLKEQLLQSASNVDEIKDWSANGLWLES